MNHCAAALNTFSEGRNCCQAVLGAFSEELGLDAATAMKVASAFGGGIGRLGEVCGAVSGALMALGLKYGEVKNKEEMHALVQQFVAEFKTLHPAIRCAELLGTAPASADAPQKAGEQLNILWDRAKCGIFIADAVKIAEKLIQNDGNPSDNSNG